MNEAYINYKILTWAIERSRMPLIDIARSVSIKPEKIKAWAEGKSLPTFRQAQKLANKLHVPFGYLFLSDIPDEKIPLPDLRTGRSEGFKEFSPDFIDLVKNILLKQNWFRDHLKDEGAEPLNFVGKYNTKAKPEEIARNIARTIGINDTLRKSAITWEDFLSKLVNLTEQAGVTVFRSGVVGNNNKRTLSVDEFRGFAISDTIAPVIFINSQDYKVSQIFTLAHELAHIWIGQSGISDISINDLIRNNNDHTEYFCNVVAAELLVPRDDFIRYWEPLLSNNENFQNMVRKFKVSNIVIIRRAFDLEFIQEAEFRRLYGEEIKNQKLRQQQRREKSTTGGDFYRTLSARNGKRLISTLLSATLEGKVNYREAARYLNVNANSINNIANQYGIK